MAEAVVDGSVFKDSLNKRKKAEERVKGARPKADSLTSFANAQVLIARSQAEDLRSQHRKRVLSEEQKKEELTTVRDRLSQLRRLRHQG